MTPKEFAERMKWFSDNNDPEMAHYNMDELMCEVLSELGYEEGIAIFCDTEKWYA